MNALGTMPRTIKPEKVTLVTMANKMAPPSIRTRRCRPCFEATMTASSTNASNNRTLA